MISQPQIETILSSLAASAQQGTFFRSIDVQFLIKGTPLSAIGSVLKGGRYNEKGMFEALYVGESQHIALLETEALILIGGKFKGIKQPPRAMLSIDVTLQHVISLHDPALLHRLGHKPAELLLPWRRAMLAGRPVLTQCIGAAASAVGIEALLVPSAKDPAYSNLAIFSANLYVGSSVTLYDPSTTAPPHIVKGHRTR